MKGDGFGISRNKAYEESFLSVIVGKRQNNLMKKPEHWIVHPFLFGVYPVVALLAYNIRQATPLVAVRSLLLVLALTLILLLASWIILRDWQKAVLVTSL